MSEAQLESDSHYELGALQPVGDISIELGTNMVDNPSNNYGINIEPMNNNEQLMLPKIVPNGNSNNIVVKSLTSQIDYPTDTYKLYSSAQNIGNR